jgi:hypothetical protein
MKEGRESLAARRLRIPLVVITILAAVCFIPRVGPFARERERGFLIDPMHVALAAGPAWLEGTLGTRVRARLAELEPAPLRDDGALARLIEGVEGSTGWIRSIDRVEKRYPNRLEVEVTLREPIAMVEAGSRLALVGADDVVVAFADEAAGYLESHPLPLVHTSAPLVGVTEGGVVVDALAREGLRVAAELRPHRETLEARGIHVEVIDVTAQERGDGNALTDVELFTRGGLPIEWGRSRSHPRFGALEPAADAKVRALVNIAARHPDLAEIRRIRLQFTDPWIERGLLAPIPATGSG